VSMRRLSQPKPAEVMVGPEGKPFTVNRSTVHLISEDWVIEDRWWTGRPLRRRYFELVLADGSNVVVFRDLERNRWFSQAG
jgi:hypothetical protein